ncbi:MAG: reverse transcriptase domain-containing protein [Halanaerobiales bacterium]
MKRHGDLYHKIIDKETLNKATLCAQQGKKHYSGVQEVNNRKVYYINELQNRLKNKTYRTSKYDIFTKKDSGKERIIYKLPFFPDRIAQWAILLIIEPLLKNKLILDTYSAIPNRGIHFGVQRINRFLKDEENTKYCLKLDIKKYYPSINHDILKQTYRGIIKDPNLLWLLEEIIDSTNWDKTPYSYETIPILKENVGIPIGNYLSQWSGNIYLHKFGHWLKEKLKLKYVMIYMDDIVIFNKSKIELKGVLNKIKTYLTKNLELTVKDNWQIFPTKVRGVDFLGYRFFGEYILLRKSITKRFKNKMRKISKKKFISEHDYTSINSYLGWLKWCNSYNLKKKYIQPLKEKIKFYERVNNIC